MDQEKIKVRVNLQFRPYIRGNPFLVVDTRSAETTDLHSVSLFYLLSLALNLSQYNLGCDNRGVNLTIKAKP